MIKIPLDLRDFKELLKNKLNLEEKNLHPVTYYEDEVEIFFYKIIGYVLYYVGLTTNKELLPEDVNIDNLKINFLAINVPHPLHIIEYVTRG